MPKRQLRSLSDLVTIRTIRCVKKEALKPSWTSLKFSSDLRVQCEKDVQLYEPFSMSLDFRSFEAFDISWDLSWLRWQTLCASLCQRSRSFDGIDGVCAGGHQTEHRAGQGPCKAPGVDVTPFFLTMCRQRLISVQLVFQRNVSGNPKKVDQGWLEQIIFRKETRPKPALRWLAVRQMLGSSQVRWRRGFAGM